MYCTWVPAVAGGRGRSSRRWVALDWTESPLGTGGGGSWGRTGLRMFAWGPCACSSQCSRLIAHLPSSIRWAATKAEPVPEPVPVPVPVPEPEAALRGSFP